MKVAVLALFLALAAATRIAEVHDCVKHNSCKSHDFRLIGKAASQQTITINVKTKCDNEDLIENTLYTVANPKSKYYGQWMSWSEIDELALNKERVAKAISFFSSKGFKTKQIRWWVEVTGTVASFEKVFNAQFNVYRSAAANMTMIRTPKATYPKELEHDAEYIEGLINFPPSRRRMMFLAPEADGNTDPNLLWQYYKIPNTPITESRATQAVFEALGQSYSPSDLSSFEQTYNIPSQTATLVGPNDGSQCTFNPNNCAEASLDIQYIIAVASGAPTTFWSISNENDPFTDWMKQQLSKGDAAPKVTSISYGGIESEQDPTSMNAFNNDLQKLAASGITVAVSSGDDGVAGYVARNDQTQCGYNPEYPASCPYVLAVGATQGPETDSTEVVCSSQTGGLITSGGGFSTVFNQPSYQSAAVSAFLAQTQAPSGYNAQGRGFPDVAMLGHNYLVVIGGTTYIVSGTSCSAPVTGGVISRANAQRLKNGKSTLGFVNLAIYQNSNTFFNRVTSGSNNCCAAQNNPVCCTQGFSAWSGWSPTTGWGSIQVDKFLATLGN